MKNTEEISKEKNAEEILKEREDAFQKKFEESKDGECYIDPTNFIVGDCNESLVAMLGVESKKDIIGKRPSDFSPEFQQDNEYSIKKEEELIKKVILERKSRFEWNHQRFDGSIIPIEVTLTYVPRGKDGRETVHVSWRDLTCIKESQRKIEENVWFFRNLFEASKDGIFIKVIKDGELVYERVDSSMLKIFGFPLEKIIGKTDKEIFGETAGKRLLEVDKRVLEGEEIDYEYSVWVNNKKKWFALTKIPWRDKSGKITGVHGIVRDMTSMKRRDVRLKVLFNENPSMLFIVDKKGIVIDVNIYGAEHLGYSTKGLIGNAVTIVFPEKNYRAVSEQIEKCFNNSKTIFQWEIEKVAKDGRLMWVRERAKIIHDPASEEDFLFIVCEDITEQKTAESQLRQSQKMDAIGKLAGGIAHDFNNLLSVILGYGQLLQKGYSKEKVEIIIDTALKGADLTQSLLAFSRKEILEMKPRNIGLAIKNTEKVLRRLVTEDIELVFRMSDENVLVDVDISQLDQVLFNLTANARDAMLNGGEIRLDIQKVFLENKIIQGSCLLGDYCLISFSDNGMGMDERTREQIFEPFFTTKEAGKGTGLGLSMVYGIVKQHGGYMDVESELEKGTTFKIYLPLSLRKEFQEKNKIEEIKGGNEVILLVEDDESVMVLTSELLQTAGYNIIRARSGNEAIKQFSLFEDRINLIISDVVMPNGNGKEAYDAITKKDPDIKFIFLSGYTRDILDKKGMKDLECLDKPISREDLLKKIREVLDR